MPQLDFPLTQGVDTHIPAELAPVGQLKVALNVCHDLAGVLQPRPGLSPDSTLGHDVSEVVALVRGNAVCRPRGLRPHVATSRPRANVLLWDFGRPQVDGFRADAESVTGALAGGAVQADGYVTSEASAERVTSAANLPAVDPPLVIEWAGQLTPGTGTAVLIEASASSGGGSLVGAAGVRWALWLDGVTLRLRRSTGASATVDYVVGTLLSVSQSVHVTVVAGPTTNASYLHGAPNAPGTGAAAAYVERTGAGTVVGARVSASSVVRTEYVRVWTGLDALVTDARIGLDWIAARQHALQVLPTHYAQPVTSDFVTTQPPRAGEVPDVGHVELSYLPGSPVIGALGAALGGDWARTESGFAAGATCRAWSAGVRLTVEIRLADGSLVLRDTAPDLGSVTSAIISVQVEQRPDRFLVAACVQGFMGGRSILLYEYLVEESRNARLSQSYEVFAGLVVALAATTSTWVVAWADNSAEYYVSSAAVGSVNASKVTLTTTGTPSSLAIGTVTPTLVAVGRRTPNERVVEYVTLGTGSAGAVTLTSVVSDVHRIVVPLSRRSGGGSTGYAIVGVGADTTRVQFARSVIGTTTWYDYPMRLWSRPVLTARGAIRAWATVGQESAAELHLVELYPGGWWRSLAVVGQGEQDWTGVDPSTHLGRTGEDGEALVPLRLFGAPRYRTAHLEPQHGPRVSAEMGTTTLLAGGRPVWIDEYGTLPTPITPRCTAAGTGSGSFSGTFSVIVTLEWTDADGARWQSAPSLPVQVTVASATGIALTMTPLREVESLRLERARLVVWTTEALGTIHYRSAEADAHAATITVPAGSVGQLGQQVLYTDTGEPPRIAPPSVSCVARARRRWWAASGRRVYYSHETVVGEGAQFCAGVFFLDLPEQIVAIGELDEVPVLLGARGVYMVVGDGPNRIGQGSWTVQQVSSDAGAVSPVVVEWAGGVAWQSRRGIEALARGGRSPEHLGQPVESLTVGHLVSGAADPLEERLHFALDDTDANRVLTYSHEHDAWYEWTYPDAVDAVHTRPDGSLSWARRPPDGSPLRLEQHAEPTGSSSESGYDERDQQWDVSGAGTAPAWTIETGDIRAQGLSRWMQWREATWTYLVRSGVSTAAGQVTMHVSTDRGVTWTAHPVPADTTVYRESQVAPALPTAPSLRLRLTGGAWGAAYSALAGTSVQIAGCTVDYDELGGTSRLAQGARR